MASSTPTVPIRRITAAGIAIVALMIAALGVTIWRSETAATLADQAVTDQKQLAVGTSGRDLLFDQRTRLASGRRVTASNLVALDSSQHAFAGVLAASRAVSDSTDLAILARVEAADAQLQPSTRAVELAAGGQLAAASRRLSRQQTALDTALDAFTAYNTKDAAAALFQSRAAP
jgi:hypothetical protein